MPIQAISSGSTNTIAGNVRAVAEKQQLAEAKQLERQQAQNAELERRKDESPKVVVNFQGQPTGTLINIIA